MRLRHLLILTALASCADVTAAQSRTYTYECVGQVKPKRGDTLIVRQDSSRADSLANCTRKKPAAPPIVIPPVVPPSAGEPVYVAGVGTLVLADNMDSYTSVAGMATTANGFRPGPDPRSELALTTGRGGTGKALRVNYPTGSQTGASWDSYPQNKRLPDTVTHYFTYDARYTFSTPLLGTLGVKHFMAWHASGNDRIQWSMHWMNPSGSPTYCTFSRSGTPFTFWQVMEKSVFAECQGAQPVGPFIEQVADGQWHRFAHEYRPHSGVGKRDGFARMWIDGVKMLDVSLASCGVVPAGAVRGIPWCSLAVLDHLAVRDGISYLKLAGAKTTSTPAFTLDFDSLVWWVR